MSERTQSNRVVPIITIVIITALAFFSYRQISLVKEAVVQQQIRLDKLEITLAKSQKFLQDGDALITQLKELNKEVEAALAAQAKSAEENEKFSVELKVSLESQNAGLKDIEKHRDELQTAIRAVTLDHQNIVQAVQGVLGQTGEEMGRIRSRVEALEEARRK